MKKHLAVFVSDGSELIGINNGDKGFAWATFNWFHDHFFMSVLNQLLERKSPAKVVFGTKQIPREWAGARPFVLSFERFMLLIEGVMNTQPPLDDIEEDKEFFYFYKICLSDSVKKMVDLRNDVKGLYKMLPDTLFVIFMIHPVASGQTTVSYLRDQWEEHMPNIDDIFKQIAKEQSDLSKE